MAQGYDPAKAAEVNRLIAQGQTPRDALAQAGITQEEFGNYNYDTKTSVLGPQNGPPSNEQSVSPASDPSQFPAYDDDGNLQPGFAINDENGEPYYRGYPSQDVTNQAVNPAFDPSQFPAYDDDGNLLPGFAINEENGGTYYRGLGPLTQQTSGFDPNFNEFGGLDEAIAAQQNATPINNPYYGLTPTQLQDLGGADPTDPYIRARLGIPQLPGSTLFATGGFGTIKTGVPLIDTALGIVGGIAGGIGSVFSNFASAIGGLFGPKPTASAAAATTGAGFAALAVPVVTPPKTDTPLPTTADPSQFPAYDDDGNLQPGFAINDENGEPYYRGFPSQDAQDTPVNPASDPSQFPAYDDDGNLQPGFAINEENGGTYYRGFERNTDQPLSVTADPSQFPAYDDDGNLQPGFAINDETGDTYYQGFERTTDRPLSPTADPSQFPAYDDDGNLQPGFAINDETGDTYYQGFERSYDVPFNPEEDPSEQSRYEAELAYNAQEPYEFGAANINDPYYGLSPDQLQALGGADPTDPYIRARLGIPQLPGETLLATPGFGTIKTGIPLIDNALSFLGGLFGSPTPPPTPAAPPVAPTTDPSQFPAYDDDGNLQPGFAINEETGEPYYQGFEKTTDQPVNPASDPSQFPAYDDDGNLQPGFAINEETGESYYRGFERNTDQPVNPASDPSQFPAYDDDGNLQPGFAINDETGETYYQGVGPATGTDSTTLNAEQADAFYNGTGTPTAAQQAETNAQTAADAAALYPGTDNTNLKNINEASTAIAQNEAGIANAQSIIDQNNAELADPDISDERRAELEANNAAQENYIRLAESNTAENELVIESNADAFAAGGGNPDSGTGAEPVAPKEDPELPQEQEPEPVEAEVPEEVNVEEDPELPQPEEDEFAAAEEAVDVDPEEEPFEARRLELEQEANREQLALEATDVEPGLFTGQSDEFGGVDEAVAIEQADIDTRNDPALSEEEIQAELDRAVESDAAEDVDTNEDNGLQVPPGAEDDEVENTEPFALNSDDDEGLPKEGGGDLANERDDAAAVDAASQNATVAKAKEQATLQARYKQPGITDWRVRLVLAEGSNYLYNADDADILKPLAGSNGVIFPYTPNITTSYTANYEQYNLIHSNYRGLFYKNSNVGDVQIRGTFTAQDTQEAQYLLSVIHFFRSVTKMFYGKDAQRGTPPPLVYLVGYGDWQFSGHPCVVGSFNYNLPNEVDYIRASSPNNYGTNLFNRRTPVAANPGGVNYSGAIRLANALLPQGALPQVPSPGPLPQSVANTNRASYVPTKMEIDITLIPVQTREQVSKQFSLKAFANGNLLKGGYW
jgi:hypothetical protein